MININAQISFPSLLREGLGVSKRRYYSPPSPLYRATVYTQIYKKNNIFVYQNKEHMDKQELVACFGDKRLEKRGLS